MDNKRNIAVFGGGSWGTTIALHLHKKGHKVDLYEYFEENVLFMKEKGESPFLSGFPLPDDMIVSSEVSEIMEGKDVLIVVTPSHTVRALTEKLKPYLKGGELFINLSKGIERNTLMRMSEVISDVLKTVPASKIVTLYGPSHAEEVCRELPTAVVAACPDLNTAREVQEIFMTPMFRVYTNPDIIGVELGGSVKNVIAIAAGILDGMGVGDNAKAALLTRGLFEITRLGVRLGAQETTFAGLSGIGDLIVTCGSRHSRNRYVGEQIGKGKKLKEVLQSMKMIAEGVKTSETVHQLVEKYNVEMPISEEVYKVLFHDKEPGKAMWDLMNRDPVLERHSLSGSE